MKKIKICLCVIMALCFVLSAISCSQEQTTDQTVVIEDDVMGILFAAIDKTFETAYEFEFGVSVGDEQGVSTHITTDGTFSSVQITDSGMPGDAVYSDGEWDYTENSRGMIKAPAKGFGDLKVLDVDVRTIGEVFKNEEVKNAVNALILKGSAEIASDSKVYAFDYVRGDLDPVADKLGEVAGLIADADSARVEISVNKDGYLASFRCTLYATKGADIEKTTVSLEVVNPGQIPSVDTPENLADYEAVAEI
ncbi:MAG: hypothetical protein IJV00_06910 [Clostridia bacterium]|nr:hypothetical protein [Clostridia bacterium]